MAKTEKDCGCGRNKKWLNKQYKNSTLEELQQQKIFVQLASYRDPQLVPTMRDMLEKADNPQNLYFGICWQRDENESLEEFANHPQVRYQDYHYSKSKGLGWARFQVSKLWDKEPFILQLDSHHRFSKHWDTMMLQDYHQSSYYSNKPLITTYLTPFEVKEYEEKGYKSLNKTPCLMSQYEFSSDKLLMSMPWYIQDFEQRRKVIKSRTISGHFIFTSSKFLKEIPYDPDIYFGGYCEETTMSLRAFTHGYDFYSPYRQYIWHEYTRADRPKHWDDHSKESKTDKTSTERDALGRSKTRQLFGIEDNNIKVLKKHNLGNKRTLHDYEIFGGFDFKNQLISDYTLQVNEPPNPTSWEKQFDLGEKTEITVEWSVDHFISEAKGRYKFITFGIIDKGGNELYRTDFTPDKHRDILSYQINSHTVRLLKHKVKGSKLVMYGMKDDNNWTSPYTKSI